MCEEVEVKECMWWHTRTHTHTHTHTHTQGGMVWICQHTTWNRIQASTHPVLLLTPTHAHNHTLKDQISIQTHLPALQTYIPWFFLPPPNHPFFFSFSDEVGPFLSLMEATLMGTTGFPSSSHDLSITQPITKYRVSFQSTTVQFHKAPGELILTLLSRP